MTKTFDIEVLQNFILFAFQDSHGEVSKISIKGKGSTLSPKDRTELLSLLTDGTIVTFNGIKYDMPITAGAVGGLTAMELYQMSQLIIGQRKQPWQMYGGRIKELTEVDHIDLIETAPAVGVGLKLYGARLFSQRLWEYEVDWDKPLNKADRKGLKKYCKNDLILTWDLYNKILPSIELRERMGELYDEELRSKSDAQIAEVVILGELGGGSKGHMPKSVTYEAPDFIKFESKELIHLHEQLNATTFNINPANGKPVAPDWLKNMVVRLGEAQFQVGLGGLHSMEKSITVKSDRSSVMRNADVASFYPRIIINSELYPPQLGERFLEVYENIVATRLKAKADTKRLKAELKELEHELSQTK